MSQVNQNMVLFLWKKKIGDLAWINKQQSMVRAVTLNLVEHAMKYEINRNKLKESVSKKKIKDNLKETMNQKLIHLPSKNVFFR